MARTIIVKGDPIHKEGDAAEALKPGMLVNFNGAPGKLIKHATAGGRAALRVVVERSYIGEDTEATIAIGERVEYVVPRAGDEVFVRLTGASGLNPGDLLASAGDGTLKLAGGSDAVIAAMIPQHYPALSTGVWRKVEAL